AALAGARRAPPHGRRPLSVARHPGPLLHDAGAGLLACRLALCRRPPALADASRRRERPGSSRTVVAGGRRGGPAGTRAGAGRAVSGRAGGPAVVADPGPP